MTDNAARAICLDASVLVKIHFEEPGSDIVRSHCAREPGRYTTPFCFYEALNVLKSKWKYQGQLTAEQYVGACTGLIAWYGGVYRAGRVRDPEFTSPETFRAVRELVQRTQLDFSDALQIFSVKCGYFSRAADDSRTVLATADVPLAAAARAEGLRVWNMVTESAPQ